MNKKAKGFLIGAGTVIGTGIAAILYYNAAKALIDLAMHRKQPKTLEKKKKKLSKSEDNAEFFKILDDCAEKLENSGCEKIEIGSIDGEKLVGHYRKSKNPKRIIIAMHGWRSSWSWDFGSIAETWYKWGCDVVYAEQRGQNNSGGSYMGFGMTERYDCLEWIKWAIENISDTLPIYLCGVSMGATTVLMASGLELPSNVHGIIADCGFTSPDAIWKHVMRDNLHLPYGSTLYDELCRKRIGIGSKDYSTLDAMKVNKTPILFIHGTDDSFVPIRMTYDNYKICKAPKKLLVVPGADHGMSHYRAKEEYEKTVKEFFREYDKKEPVSVN